MVSSDRGQVLLLGGLAIAIVFLTAIPLSNSLVVTESASSSETVSDINRVAQQEASAERGVRTVLAEMNASDTAALNQSLRNFTKYYTNVSGQRDGVYVDASINLAASGRKFDSENYTEPGGPPGQPEPWYPVNNTTRISTFNVTFSDLPSSGTPGQNPFNITISNDTGVQYVLEGHYNNSEKKLVVETHNGSTTSTTCRADDGENISVNIIDGTCYIGSSTSKPARKFTVDDDEYDIQFSKMAQNAEGSFLLVGAGDFYLGGPTGIVNPAVDLTFVGPDVSYDRTIVVNDTS